MDRYHDEVALLVAQTGPLNGKQWALKDTIIFGRDESSTIVIPDRQVSRHHAQITSTPAGMVLEDLGSKNGTHRNGQLLEGKVLLQDSDVIQIALVQKFVFFSSDATLPLNIAPISSSPGATTVEPVMQESSPGVTHTPTPVNRLRLDKRSHRVWVWQRQDSGSAQRVETEVLPPLSISQYLLLEILYDNAGEVVSREALVGKIWGQEQSYEYSEQALDALVRRLRERLASVDSDFDYIKTVRGHGLRLENPAL